MNTTTIPLHRPRWLRALHDIRELLARRHPPPPDVDWHALSHLDTETLRDIGAPDWLQARDRGLPLWTLERGRL